ncbi:MAG: hemolysin family protein [Lachnospiraceae bacterium]|nr:hemolysin family protein [Lachnospiraceae bacterium]
MSTADITDLSVLLLLLVLSAFFSSAETAMTTANKIRMRSLAEEGNKKAVTMLKIMEQPQKMLSAILIGNNLVNISASSLATSITMRLFGNRAVAVSTGLLTLVVLIFGEITPKTMAALNAEKLSLSYSGVIWNLMRLMTPVIIIVDYLSGCVLRLFKSNTYEQSDMITEKDLRTMVDAGHEDGALENTEHKMISNVFDFGASLARDIMVPRSEMICINSTDSYHEVWEIFKNEKLTRLPVCGENRDDIVGILNIKDFMFYEDPEHFRPSDIMYEPYFTFEYKKTSELMSEMRTHSISLAIVLDEYGTVAGMITFEDLLEELVGEIRDEFDEDEEDLIKETAPGEFMIEGSVKLDDVNEALGTRLYSEDYDSIAGYIIGSLDHLPAIGETVETEDGCTLTVAEIERNRIAKVRLLLPKAEAAKAPEKPQNQPPALDPVK